MKRSPEFARNAALALVAVAALGWYAHRSLTCPPAPGSGADAPSPAQASVAKFEGKSMGASYHVTLTGTLSKEAVLRAHKAVEAALEDVNTKMSTYREDSELSRFNRHPGTDPFPVSADTAEVFRIALAVSEQSDGAFDITVGPLVNAWGFGPDPEGPPPDEAAVAVLRERVGWRLVSVDAENRLAKTRPDVYCDLSAVAKGYAVDKAAEALETLGVAGYMVEVGGEVRAKGEGPRGGPWRIGVERPQYGERSVQEVVLLGSGALATSGDYRNFRMVDGKRFSHTVDPKTGNPIEHALASASVLHASCAWADAYATALMVLGPEAGRAFAEKRVLAASLLVHAGEDRFDAVNTPAFDAALEAPTASSQ